MCKRTRFLEKKLSHLFKNNNSYAVDIIDEFKEIRFKFIKNAINYNLKSLNKNEKINTQIVCIWIRNYIEFININKQKI